MDDTLLELTGSGLTIDRLEAAASGCPSIALSAGGLARMSAARAAVDHAVETRTPVYGVTTGLGAKAGQALAQTELEAFSKQAVLGRAHACGSRLSREQVRASLLIRLNTLLLGAAGARPEVAQYLKTFLEANITPVCGSVGSIGTGDLVLNATVALPLIGEGEVETADENTVPAMEALTAVGLAPLPLAARDGLALINHTGMSAGIASLAFSKCARVFHGMQCAAALSIEGFRGNLTAFDRKGLALKSHRGQSEAAEGILQTLGQSALLDTANARRLQDPLSFRNIPQIHGSALATLTDARDTAHIEINGSSDNPACLPEDGGVISTGLYLTSHLTRALETLSASLADMAAASVARISKMMSTKFTDLPVFLAAPGATSNGFAPVLKSVEALAMEIQKEAAPVRSWPSINADGVEDILCPSITQGLSLDRLAGHLSRLCAIEMLVAAQAIELRETALAGPSQDVWNEVRSRSAFLAGDRPLGADIERIHSAVSSGVFGSARFDG